MINDENFIKYSDQWHKDVKFLIDQLLMLQHCGSKEDLDSAKEIELELKNIYGIETEDKEHKEIYYLAKKYSIIR